MAIFEKLVPDKAGNVIVVDADMLRVFGEGQVSLLYRLLAEDWLSWRYLYCRNGWRGWIPRIHMALFHAEHRLGRWIIRHMPVEHPINEYFQWRKLRLRSTDAPVPPG